ncbi:MAG: efflux transporter outer membrane subunit [Pigmentiphaga sp.]
MKMRFLALSISAALAGCSLAPEYTQPVAPVPADWGERGQPQAGGEQRRAVDIGWRQFFNDARLQRLIELGLENNRDLRVAIQNIEVARAQYGVTRADQFPAIGANAQAARNRVAEGQSPTGQASLGTTYQVNLGVTAFELDLFGRVRNLSQAALAQYLATEEAWRSTHIALVAQIANAYLNERSAEEAWKIADDTLTVRRESFDLVKLRYDAGISSEVELSQAESLVQTAEVAKAVADRNRAQAGNALQLLIGQSLPADLPPARPLSEQRLLADIPAGLSSDLIQQRPDIRAAEQQLLAANASIGAARAAFFPRIALTGSFGTASTQLDGLFGSGSLAWSFIPQISLPIFTAGRNQANLDIAEARNHIAVANYEKSIQQAFREVADGLDAKETLERQIQAQQRVADAARRSFELVDIRYRNGIEGYLQVLDAQREVFNAEQALLSAQTLRLSNLVELYKSLGGGWQETGLTPVAEAPPAVTN